VKEVEDLFLPEQKLRQLICEV